MAGLIHGIFFGFGVVTLVGASFGLLAVRVLVD